MEEQKKDSKTAKSKKFRVFRIIGRIILGIVIFGLLLILFIRSPWGQGIIVNKATSYISNKTNTKVEIERLFLTFDGNLQVDGLFLEDTQGDTLVYSKSLEANVPLWAMIRGEGVGVDALDWEGVRANIKRTDSIEGYNFQFLIDAFAVTDTTAVATDTTAAPMSIVLGKLNFKDFDIVFDDAVAGIESRFKIGKLQANMKTTNLERMIFEASNLSLTDAKIKYIQKPVPIDPNAEAMPLPSLTVEKLTLTNVYADYQSYGDRIAAEADIKNLYAEIQQADLANNRFEVRSFNLKNSSVILRTQTETNVVTQKVVEVTQDIKQDIQAFEWPELRLAIGSIDFQDNNFSYFVAAAEAKEGSFNPNAIVLNNLNLQADNINLKDKKATLHIENSTFKEISGFDLKELQLQFDADDTTLKVSNLKTALNNNTLQADLRLDYPKLSALIETPEKSKIDVNIPNFQVSLQDVFLIQPELKKNQYLNTLSQNLLSGNAKATGYLSDINVARMAAHWANTHISANGRIKNATDPEQIQFDIPNFSAISTRSDIIKFIDEKELGVSLPNEVKLVGTIKGNPNDLYTNATLTTSQGVASVEGNLKNGKTIEFDADLSIENYKLNELLQNEQLGTLSLTVKTNGKGKTINNLDADIEATISSFTYNNYDIKDLKLVGDIKAGRGKVTSTYKDRNLNMDLYAAVVLDSVSPEANVELNIMGADLRALGLMQREVKTGMKIYADFKGDATNYDVAAIVDEGVVVYDNKTYLIGDLNALAHVRKDTTSVSIKNKLVDVLLQSNTDPQTFSKSIRRHVLSYFYRDEKLPDSITNPVNLKLRGKIIQAPILNDVFLVNVKDLDTVKISVDFHEKERQFKADITAPHINYSGYELDSLAFSMETDQDKFVFDLGFNQIKAGPFNIQRTKLEGEQANNELSLAFKAYHNEEILTQITSKITGSRELLRFHVVPEDLILNTSPWDTPETNEILISDKKMEFNNFLFSRDNQSFEITDKLASITKEHIAADFKNFKLSEFLNYLNPDEQLATGNLNGFFVLEDPFTNTGIVADLNIQELSFMQVDMGTLSLDAKSLGLDSYDFNVNIDGGEIDMNLKGDYVALAGDAQLDMNLDITKFNMAALTGFSQGELIETDGSFSGNFKLSGNLSAPKYEGNLNFNNAHFKIKRFNSAFTLANESLNITNAGLFMDSFTILDENQNALVASGNIGTESFINPTFDLQMTAKNFQVLNATKEDNDFLYGKVTFDAEAKITGDLQIPKITMNATVGSDTDVTYVMPSATVNVEERDGVVVFVNRENPDAILTRTEEKTATITGFDIAALLKIGKDAAVTIVIDEETGDNFKVSGKGDLNFTMNPNGNLTLSGIYEVQSGHYELNLYSLVNRKFNLVSGSRITWSGDPFDAKLDVRALYEVKTSASSLMAPTTSNLDESSKGKYRQVLPFYVYLNIDGQLMQPKINFNLDMPQDEQGAIGGQVYGRVQQLNQQEDELNRQVFSLLVLNRFYPDPGSDGSTGGVASIARDNLNDAVSDQLNMFSDKLFSNSGFDLNFGLDSYTDYQGSTPQDRTQLDIAAQKKLFNDRLIVSVGSEVDVQGSSSTGEETPIIGNVSIEYILTENGRYRLKGFHRNEFENVIDGQIIVSGIALIFTQEFNKFSELWDALVKSKTKQEKEAAKEKKAAKDALKAKEEAVDDSIEEKKQ
ncbi:translocation/assembly module TamB domain-containing protein [Gelidibacter salicanalis]|uniref:Translocation/assembly module TamB domain-containing protein n=1 Tax=Gelidibacter salicanalis TaxID=291193 RepID=A0A934KV43_9FLAO|nr:translocation/assembly module TamB [Gelidibacter salicanalis]MBJ7880793.1 translocation/assembly module TamB domain-containing protein [Gelidibacter salicanalis]